MTFRQRFSQLPDGALYAEEVAELLDAIDNAAKQERERIRSEYIASHVSEGPEAFYRGIDAASANLFTILDGEIK